MRKAGENSSKSWSKLGILVLLFSLVLIVTGAENEQHESILERYNSEEDLMKKFRIKIEEGTKRILVHVKVREYLVMDESFLNKMAELMNVDNYKEFQFHSDIPVFTTRLTPQQIRKISSNSFIRSSVEWIKKVTNSDKRAFSKLTLESFKIGGLRIVLDSKLNEMERLQTLNRLRNWYIATYTNKMSTLLSSIVLQSDDFKLDSSVKERNTFEMKDFLREQTDTLFGLEWNIESTDLQISLANFDYGVWRLIKQKQFDHPIVQSLRRREQIQKVFKRSNSLGLFVNTISEEVGQELLEHLINDDSVDMVSRQLNYEIKNYGSNQVIQNGGGSSYTYMWDNGITGSNEVVSVLDTGVSIGHCFFTASGEPTTKTTVNLNYRKVVYYGQNGDYGDLLDENGHGTHTAGTIAGYPQTTPTSTIVSSNVGVAKDAKIYAVDVQKGADGGLYIGDVSTILKNAFTNAGSRISSNSWGCASPYDCSFDCDCYETKSDGSSVKVSDDQCIKESGVRCCHYCNVYDTDSAKMDSYLNSNDEVTVLVAAGNEGKSAKDSTLGAPATSKNVLTVGASYATTAYYKKFYNFPSYTLYNSENMLGLSSRGPTYDGRIKPDVVAPGFEIISASNTDSCGVKGMSGTSMATPAVSGASALVRHYLLKDNKKKLVDYNIFNKATSQTLSGTLVKAMIIHSSDSMKGTVQIDGKDNTLTQFASPNKYNGFGRVDLLNVLKIDTDADSVSRIKNIHLANRYPLDANKQVIMSFSANSPTFIKATITWYDLSSTPDSVSSVKTKKLINNLNLIVAVGGVNYFGNNGTSVDSLNTAESVTIQHIAEGTSITVRVGAMKNNRGTQAFSMVITGDVTLIGTPAAQSTIPPGDPISRSSSISISLAFIFTIASLIILF